MNIRLSIIVFALYYVLATLFVAAVAYLVQTNVHLSVSFVILLIAAHLTVQRFVRANGRTLNKKEVAWLALGSLTVTVALALATPAVLALLRDGTQGLSRFLGYIGTRTFIQWLAALLVWGLELVVLLGVYGWWARKYTEKWGNPKPADIEPRSRARRQTAG